MKTPRFSTLALATIILWGLGCALWITNYLLEPPPSALDHALRSVPVYAFGALLCLGSGRALGKLHDHVGPRLLALLAIVGVTAATILLCLFYEMVFHVIVPRWGEASWTNVLQQMPMMSWLFGAWLLLYFALVADTARRDSEVRLAQATTTAIDAQHQLLVQQINPHFLFNALNTVYALSLEGDSTRAQRCLLALSAFLRSSIDRSVLRDVALSHELTSIKNYLQIELTRFGERLHLVESVPQNLLTCRVPSLILQPIVENCIKHGLSGNARSMTIWVSAARERDHIVLRVENDGRSPSEEDAIAPGVGLSNVSKRLDLLYGADAQMTAQFRPGGGFDVRLQLPAS